MRGQYTENSVVCLVLSVNKFACYSVRTNEGLLLRVMLRCLNLFESDRNYSILQRYNS